MQRKITSEIDPNSNNTRLDLWLSSRFNYHSRNQWQSIIKKGEILVNGAKSKASKILLTGDKIEFIIDEYNEPDVNRNYKIIFEDENIFAVNKPPDLPCHPAGIYFKNTLASILHADLNKKLYLINRLDRETSGIVLFAKNINNAKFLSNLFASRNIYKEYIVAVHGNFPDKLDSAGYLTDDTESIIRKKRKFVPTENVNNNLEKDKLEYCETYFELINSVNNFSLLKVIPKTGRLHQIRATLCSIGYPVIGDKIYGLDDTIFERFINNEITYKDKEKLILDHQALHAKCISFSTSSKQTINITTEMPSDIQRIFC
ncbi:MAG TPA: RluA family pseudouridine synthase [Victivallales bacterium]|nr:RluA family pseudouridine synthase [Victivallales bacterium]